MTSDVPSDEELRARLSDEQYRVTQQKGTERAFTGAYVDHKADGTYRCVCCNAELFSSTHKYDSGSGWPSFWLPLAGDAVRTHVDTSHGMESSVAAAVRTSGTYSTMARRLRACATASIRHHSISRPVRPALPTNLTMKATHNDITHTSLPVPGGVHCIGLYARRRLRQVRRDRVGG